MWRRGPPPTIAKDLVGEVSASFGALKVSAAQLEKIGLQRWLKSRTDAAVAKVFSASLQAQAASALRTELAGEHSSWLAALCKAVEASKCSPPDAMGQQVVNRIILDDEVAERISGDIMVDGVSTHTDAALNSLVCAELYGIMKLAIEDFAPPKWEEAVVFDPPMKNIIDFKRAMQAVHDLVKGKRCEASIGTRLDVLSARLAWCGISYMRCRCEEIDGRLEKISKLVGEGPLLDTMSKLDVADLGTLSEADRAAMLQVATKSAEMKALVEAYNDFDSICAWPTAIKRQLDGIHSAIGPKTDILDAQIREKA